MNDPKLMILQMLSDGKITAEQAELLLKAIKDEPETSRHRPEVVIDRIRTGKVGRAIEKAMRSMPDIATTLNEAFEEVGETLSSSIRSMLEDVGMKGGEQVIEAPVDARVKIKHGGGSLSLVGIEGNQIKISGSRRRCKVEGNTVDIVSGGGSTTIELPRRISTLDAKVGGGNLALENLESDVTASAAGGNVTLMNISGESVHGNSTGGNLALRDIQASSMKFRSAGGNIKAELGTITSGRLELNSYGGGIELKLLPDSAFEISIDSFGGDVYSEFELHDARAERGSFKGKYNQGGASISISAKGGDARLLSR
ncbi:MAG: DUF4097 family beta strand repeat protein [Candidatus Tectomicrobia bacterium]|nr:DUF4097 family beta strand repeat protein [Candidatus Tectomicrobia bacterium]